MTRQSPDFLFDHFIQYSYSLKSSNYVALFDDMQSSLKKGHRNIEKLIEKLISPLATFLFNYHRAGQKLPIGQFIIVHNKDFSAKELGYVTTNHKVYKQFSKKSLSWLAFCYVRSHNAIIIRPSILLSSAIEEKYPYTYSSFVALCQLLHEIGHLTLHWDSLLPSLQDVSSQLHIVNKAEFYMEREAWTFAQEMVKAFHKNNFLSDIQLQIIEKIIFENLALTD